MNRLGWTLLGIVIGGVGVWLLDSRPRAAHQADLPTDHQPATPASLVVAPTQAPSPDRKDATSPQYPFDAGGAQAISDAAKALQLPVAEGIVDALLTRAKDAIARGDKALFKSLIEALGATRHARAHTALVEWMGDVTIPFPRALGRLFFDALKSTSVPGVVPAARARFEAERAAHEPSWATGRWLQLIGRFGNDPSLDWLMAFPDGPYRNSAHAAVAGSPSKQAARVYEAFVRANANDDGALRWIAGFAHEHPEEGFRLAIDVLQRPRENPSQHHVALLLASGGAVSPDQLHELRDALSAVAKDRPLHIISAIEAVRRRGLDLTPFRALIEAPVLALEQVDPDNAGANIASAAILALPNNRVLWSERMARALDHAADTLRQANTSNRLIQQLTTSAATIRQSLTSHWK